MAKVKAKECFAGVVTMAIGDVREIENEEIVKDLVRAGYVEEINEKAPVKAPKKKGEE